MDVKEVPVAKAQQANLSNPAVIARKSARELTADKIDTTRSESVSVELHSRSERTTRPNREKANELINTLNVVSSATEEIDRLVTSLAGLAEQAAKPDLPESRREILDKEAKQLVEAIGNRVNVETPPGVRPLQGDAIRVEIEQELGKTLEIILPDATPEKLGISAISLSPAERIISTRVAIESARSRLEELRSSVDDTKQTISKVLTQQDIASANREASEVSLRDVDEALKLTGGIKQIINDDPESFVQASKLAEDSLRLLQTD
ncbi:MAG: hypothetical protein KDD60_07495 [Bdellovibrionales bacterium]|nr:hypothetical protein [Bdellovibrionales bacterium]